MFGGDQGAGEPGAERQRERFEGTRIYANAQMGPKEVKAFCRIGRDGEKLLEAAVNRLGFSARAYNRPKSGAGRSLIWPERRTSARPI